MSAEYKLPDVGEGLTEAELISWQVRVGDEVAVNDVVCEIETAKSIVELPSPFAGRVEALLVAEGETVEVGTAILRIDDGSATESPAATGGDVGAQPTLVGYGPKEVTAQRRARRAAAPNDPAAAAAQMQIQGSWVPDEAPTKDIGLHAAEAPTPEPVRQPRAPSPPRPAPSAGTLAAPAVRLLARERGLDLSSVTGTGPHGSITMSDLDRVGATTVGARETREPIKGVRRVMAQAMIDSAFTAPHVTEWISVDATRTMELVAQLRDRPEYAGVRVTPLLVVARACLLALRRTPLLNSHWDEQAQEIVIKHYVNLGFAAATPRGLVVPNVKDANRLTTVELATAMEELFEIAREGRIQPAQTAEGTFTITNIGVFGIEGGTPIINPGQSAILAFGAINRRPWVVGSGATETLTIRDVTTLSLAFDHRHIDGETASRFLADVAALMNDPALALAY